MAPVDLQFALLALSSLFAIIDPIGCIPVFLHLTAGCTPERRRTIATRAVLVAFATLLFFATSGLSFFRVFGITLPAFRIAGGLIFFGIGMEMVRGETSRTAYSPGTGEESGPAREDPTVIPLAIPLISGPGAITTVIVLMSDARDPSAVATVLGAVVLVLAATLVILRLSDAISRRLGSGGLKVVMRLMGMIVLVIAVQFVIDGAAAVLRDALASQQGGVGVE